MATGGVLAPLRRSDFRRLWIAQTVSIVGDKINQVALLIMVYRATGSFAQMGLVFALTFLPAALFGLVSGPLVDRWDRRRTMIAADVIRAGLVIMIPFAAPLGLWTVYALAFASATVSLLFEPSRMALVPAVVEQDELMAANALDATTASIAELLGIGFAGALVAGVGPSSAFFIDGATFVISALFVLALRHRAAPREFVPLGFTVMWRELRSGIDRIREDGVLRGLLLTYTAVAIGAGAAITLAFVLALDVYKGSGLPDALRLTVVDLSTTAGLLIGSIAIGMGGSRRAGRKYLWGIVAFGVLLLPLYFVKGIGVAAVVLFALGVANEYFGIPMVTILQTHTEDETRGRVFAVRMTVTRIASVIGLAGAGIAAQAYGATPMIVVVGVYLASIGLFGFLMPALREA
jgi:DHA3 family macrolide efflux protein-like MFS transporter